MGDNIRRMMSQTQQAEFGKIRSYLWPVHHYELRKLAPMLLLFFLISLNYNILRTMKDAVVVTAKASGAEVIPFIKVWVMFPMSIVMTLLFSRLSNWMSREKVFYVMMSIFLGFYFVFTFVLYPMRDSLHPHALADQMQATLPLGLKGFVAMCRNWTFTTFYVMSEMWSNIVFFVLIWGFANEITRVSEAKRFYGLLGIGGNFAGVAAGQLSILLCSNTYNAAFPGQDAWEQSLIMLTIVILVVGLASIVIYRWMNRNILTDPRYYDPAESVRKDAPTRMSLRENFACLFRSRYLVCLAVIVIAYNIVINLVEVVWKHQLRELYPNPNDYNTYMNQVSTVIGIIATLTALFISGNSIRKLGWTFTALITPVILLITSIGFFTFFFFKGNMSGMVVSLFGTTPLALTVFFGSAQNCLARGAKYTVFDATKELAFVPLTTEMKIKGKASIDGVCSRLGKSGGSVIHQVLLVCFSTITASAPYVAGVLFVMIGLWTIATCSLGRKFNELTGGEKVLPESLLQESSPSEEAAPLATPTHKTLPPDQVVVATTQ